MTKSLEERVKLYLMRMMNGLVVKNEWNDTCIAGTRMNNISDALLDRSSNQKNEIDGMKEWGVWMACNVL
jgi:hypothetical protein